MVDRTGVYKGWTYETEFLTVRILKVNLKQEILLLILSKQKPKFSVTRNSDKPV